MDLDQLRYFLRVAERQNFTRAAEELGISQPALSRSIQKLEDELGQPVLERKTRSVSLTDAGVLLQSRAQQALTILEDTKAEITDDGQATVYGRPITVPDDLTPAAAALAAAAAEAALIPGTADIVRVAATDPSGTTWPLAVTADGRVLQLTEPVATKRQWLRGWRQK